jgi:hypothetical protein
MDDNIKQDKGDRRSMRFVGKIWLDTWPEGVDPFEKIASFIGPTEIRFMGYVKETCSSTERAYLSCWIHFYHCVRMAQVRKRFPGCDITSTWEPFSQDELYLSNESTMIKHGEFIKERNLKKRSFDDVMDTTHKKANTTCKLSDAGDKSIIDDSSKRIDELRERLDKSDKQNEELRGELRKQNEELCKQNEELRERIKKIAESTIKKQFDDRYRTPFEAQWGSEIHSATIVLRLVYRHISPLGLDFTLSVNPTREEICSTVKTALKNYMAAYDKPKDCLAKMDFGMVVDLLKHMIHQFDTKKKEDGDLFKIV